MNSKPFWASKTFWTNLIAIIGVFSVKQTGHDITAEQTTFLLGLINITLRFVSKDKITLS